MHLISNMRVLLLCVWLLTGTTYGQIIHSYVNENGVKVFTNTPHHSAEPLTRYSSRDSRENDPAEDFRPLIQDASLRYGIDSQLIEAIIHVESAFDPVAVSSKNCKGLMQLHPDTARRFGVLNVFDPAENIDGGVRYLQFLLDEFDQDLELAVAAYNAGENAVRKYEGIPPYDETQRYVKKVASLYDLARTPRDNSNSDSNSRNHRVYRFSLPNGSLLFTNTPTHSDTDGR